MSYCIDKSEKLKRHILAKFSKPMRQNRFPLQMMKSSIFYQGKKVTLSSDQGEID